MPVRKAIDPARMDEWVKLDALSLLIADLYSHQRVEDELPGLDPQELSHAIGADLYSELWGGLEDYTVDADHLDYALATIRAELVLARLMRALADSAEGLRERADYFDRLAARHARDVLAEGKLDQEGVLAITHALIDPAREERDDA